MSCRRALCLAVGVSRLGPNNGMDSKAGLYHQNIFSERLASSGGGTPKPGSDQWRAIKAPKPGSGSALLTGVSCRFSNVCKGAGTYFDVKRQRWRTLIEVWQDHWRLNGPALCNHHCQTSIPNTKAHKNILSAVSCVTSNSCLTVGQTVSVGENRLIEPLALWLAHTTGYRWVLTAPL